MIRATTLRATMPLRLLLLVSCFLGALALPATTSAQDEDVSREVIREGYSAGGMDLGGQTVESAEANLVLAFGRQYNRKITVKAANKSYELDPAEDAKLVFDAALTAKRAYYAGLTSQPDTDVPLAVTFKKRAVQRWANAADRDVSIAPRNAKLRITLRHMLVSKTKNGRTINEVSLARRLNLTLVDMSRPRTLRSKIVVDHPETTKRTLQRRYPTVVTVDRDNKRLRLFKRLKISKRYDIAIGMAGFDTPTGLFNIQSKQVNPVWNVPDSDWAGSLRGQRIPGGAPNNPLRARWLGVNGAVGIHGTSEEWSIGTRASRGCIRMRVRDVIDLYPRVPMGAPVLIR